MFGTVGAAAESLEKKEREGGGDEQTGGGLEGVGVIGRREKR